MHERPDSGDEEARFFELPAGKLSRLDVLSFLLQCTLRSNGSLEQLVGKVRVVKEVLQSHSWNGARGAVATSKASVPALSASMKVKEKMRTGATEILLGGEGEPITQLVFV